MGEYLENAMKKFLDDRGITYGKIFQKGFGSITFEWISADISMRIIDDFEHGFHVSQTGSSGVEIDKWLDVTFDFD